MGVLGGDEQLAGAAAEGAVLGGYRFDGYKSDPPKPRAATVVVHTDARLTPFDLGALRISFRKTAPSKLYWAGRPAMRVVQALHWLKDSIPADGPQLRRRLGRILADPAHGAAIVQDLQDGLGALPAWMQDFLRPLLQDQGALADAHE